jgi:stage V sporulation protein D (sporulation-specific penicillin-binding protein)
MSAKRQWNPRMKPRIVVVFYLMVLFVGYLGYNLVQVQAKQRLRNEPPKGFDSLKAMARAYHTGQLAIPALRGSILDRNHDILAASLTLPSIAANPSRLTPEERPQLALFLARAMNGNAHDILAMLNRRTTFVWLGRKMPAKVGERVEKYARQRDAALPRESKFLGGIFVLHEPTGKRFYPKGRLAVHLLGYTGIDDNGLDGIEGVYDHILRGEPGSLEAEMDREGRAIPDGWSHLQPSRPGHSIVLTIDESIQYVAERELTKAIRTYHGSSGTCIVMDARNGDILAMVNKPDYETRDAAHTPIGLRRNRAISDTYEPGSTFKIVTACAALDSGKIRLTQSFYCGDTIAVDGWTIHNADDGEAAMSGSATITEIITHSFNVGTTAVALYIGKKTMQQYIDRFGFGRTTGLPLPGEAEGLIQPYKGWANITLATTSFGQGITVTPIQLACAMQAIANKGVLYKPRLVREIVDADGKVVKRIPPTIRRRVISVKTAREMTAILRNVVTHGTGKNADNPIYPAAGKTGTANIVENGVYGSKYNASFLGFAPLNDPRVVILVKVTDPHPIHWGGSVAAPVFQVVSREALWRLGVRPLDIAEKDHRKTSAKKATSGSPD